MWTLVHANWPHEDLVSKPNSEIYRFARSLSRGLKSTLRSIFHGESIFEQMDVPHFFRTFLIFLQNDRFQNFLLAPL